MDDSEQGWIPSKEVRTLPSVAESIFAVSPMSPFAVVIRS